VKLKTTPRQWDLIRAAIHRHCPADSTPCMTCKMYLDVLDDLKALLNDRSSLSLLWKDDSRPGV
jgi:hypothetical protein